MIPFGEFSAGYPHFAIDLLAIYDSHDLVIFAGIFAVGVTTAFADRTTLRRFLAIAFIACVMSWRGSASLMVSWDCLIAVTSVYVGRFINLDRFIPIHADVSYGFYIYAYPVTQLMVTVFAGSPHHIRAYASAFALTMALAIASWYAVEKPFLRLKPILSRKLRQFTRGRKTIRAAPDDFAQPTM